MPVESLFPRLEPLLPQVQKPIQYVGGELNSTVKDWDAVRRPLGADVPGRLRGRPAQPGRHDPLRGAQRARRRPRRAHLHRLAGPRGADARARGARSSPSTRTARSAPSTCSASASPPSSATPTCSRRSTSPASRCTPRPHRGPPDRPRRRARGLQPRADRRLRRRRGPRRRRAGGARRSPRSSAAGRPTGAPAAARGCCCGWPAPAASTCRRFYDVDYLPDGRIRRVAPNRPGVPCAGRQAHRHGPRRVALPEAAARAARRDGARAHVASRSSAAAPAAAGSARPA